MDVKDEWLIASRLHVFSRVGDFFVVSTFTEGEDEEEENDHEHKLFMSGYNWGMHSTRFFDGCIASHNTLYRCSRNQEELKFYVYEIYSVVCAVASAKEDNAAHWILEVGKLVGAYIFEGVTIQDVQKILRDRYHG